MRGKQKGRLPVMPSMCGTCPFRQGSPHSDLAPLLTESALAESSMVCHSTGSGNAINSRTGVRPKICRGARDVQLAHFHGIGFITAATDAAWEAKCKEMNL